jgi:hypothetical protein
MTTDETRARRALKEELERRGAAPRRRLSSIRSTCATTASSSPKPNTQAVMFCLMDVSGSMTEHMKDLAKRFYMLLHVFLKRRYEQCRRRLHPPHHEAPGGRRGDLLPQPPDRRHHRLDRARGDAASRQSERYRPRLEHLCGAGLGRRQFAIGGQRRCTAELLTEMILPLCQYFAYIEVGDERERQHGFEMPPNCGASRSVALPISGWRRPQARRFRHAQGRRPARDLPGVPRAVRQASPRRRGRAMTAPAKAAIPCSRERTGISTTMQRVYDAIEEIALNELGLDVYPNQIEVITAEQMLDAYSSVGMPLMYKHWSFGKHSPATRRSTARAIRARL